MTLKKVILQASKVTTLFVIIASVLFDKAYAEADAAPRQVSSILQIAFFKPKKYMQIIREVCFCYEENLTRCEAVRKSLALNVE